MGYINMDNVSTIHHEVNKDNSRHISVALMNKSVEVYNNNIHAEEYNSLMNYLDHKSKMEENDALNENLKEFLAKKKFQDDLTRRLNVMMIAVLIFCCYWYLCSM